MNVALKSGQLSQSIAGVLQEMIAPMVWVGSQQINVAQQMIDMVELVQQLTAQLG